MLLAGEGMDIRLASGGLQVARLVAEWSPDAVILDPVCVTGRPGEEDRAKAAQSGFRHFVAKPYDARKLIRLVTSVPLRTAAVVGYITPAAAKPPISPSS
jgi:CheY-like chemotaxis protein